RDTLPHMGTSVTQTGPGYRGGPVVVALTAPSSVGLVGILFAAMGAASPGRGAGLLALALLAAAALVGWHAVGLLRGQRRLSVTGLAVQSALLIGAIALATQRPGAGAAGIVVAA